MAYNPAYNKPADWSNEILDDVKLNKMIDNTHHNYLYKPELGPNAPTDLPIKIARGKHQFTANGTGGYQNIEGISFSDALDGDPGFSNIPVLIISIQEAGTGSPAMILAQQIWNLSNTSFDLWIEWESANSADYVIHWVAIGN